MVQVSSRPVDFFARHLMASLLAVASATSLAACKPESEANAATESSARAPGAEPVAEASAAATATPVPASNYLLTVNGYTTRVLTPTGGNRKGVVAKVGQNKYIGSTSIEPIVFQYPVALNDNLQSWITNAQAPRDGSIDYLDYNFHRVDTLDFHSARLSEVRFPAMVAAGDSTDTISVKLIPASTDRSAGGGTAPASPPIHNWLQNKFRVELDGLDGSHVQRVEAFSLKFGVGSAGTTVTDVGNLLLTMPRNYADGWMDWADDFLSHTSSPNPGEREGKLVYLAPDLDAILTVNLHNVGIVRVSDAPNDPTHVIVELYVESVSITQL